MKDHIRDYATDAFRYYARLGRPTYEELRLAIYNAALESSRREIEHVQEPLPDPTAAAVANAQRALDEREGELRDIDAVCRTIEIMQHEGRQDCLLALEYVYFAAPDQPLERGDITDRVHSASINIPVSERSVFYWLSKARMLFAIERGLRV
jgi:hypothetical protein